MEKIKFEIRGHEPFYMEIKAAVAEHMAANKLDRYANGAAWRKFWFYALMIVSSYALLLSGQVTSLVGLQITAIVFGIGCLMMSINVAHDAVHQCFAKSRVLNKLLYTVSFGLVGVSGYLWQMGHETHHAFPNIKGGDMDITENPFLRLSPHHKLRRYQKFQAIYAPVVYWLFSIMTIVVQDIFYLRQKNMGNNHNIKHPKREYWIFAGVKLFYFAVVLLVPYLVLDLSLPQFITGYLVVNFVISVLFIVILSGTHIADENDFPELGRDNIIKGSWARHALYTSLDWNTQSRLANFLAGGANCHAAHHLFPGICHIHYPQISLIIKEKLQQHGIEYKHRNRRQMIKSHFRHLQAMSRPQMAA